MCRWSSVAPVIWKKWTMGREVDADCKRADWCRMLNDESCRTDSVRTMWVFAVDSGHDLRF